MPTKRCSSTDVGLGEALVDVAEVVIDAGVDVVLAARRLVDLRGAVGQRLEGVEDRRQQLVLDLDELHRALGGGFVHRRHRGDLVADEAHLVLGQHVLVVACRADAVQDVGDVGAGDHRLDAGQGLRPWRCRCS